MARRRIVPDTSVVIASFFAEQHSRPAKRLMDAVRLQQVIAFAPHAVASEFIKGCAARISRRDRSPIDPEIVNRQAEGFIDLARSITFVRETDILDEAWRLIKDESVSPPDSWMLACAIHADAELWLTHDHSDGFVTAARSLHHSVFTLAQDAKHLP